MRSTRQKDHGDPAAFTLLELCIAILIAVMIILAAVPSISGLMAEQRAKKLFTEFDELARKASMTAVEERRAYALVWDDSSVVMRPLAPADKKEAAGTGRVDFGKKMAPDLFLPASLAKAPPRVWTFWPTATCEPATIKCHVPDASWTATYDPLTEQAVFSSP
jgi:type II secretory pathway pseudopilin PulG